MIDCSKRPWTTRRHRVIASIIYSELDDEEEHIDRRLTTTQHTWTLIQLLFLFYFCMRSSAYTNNKSERTRQMANTFINRINAIIYIEKYEYEHARNE